MSWIPGHWMGIFWMGLGVFMLVASWLGKASFYMPRLHINLGWIVIALGALRVWWWWTTEESPRRRKLESDAELLKMEREFQEQYEKEQQEAQEAQEEAAQKESKPAPAKEKDA